MASQVGRGDKWEAYYIQSNGYGRKRLRVGDVFDTAEEAAKAYSIQCRVMLLQEMEDRDDEGGGGDREARRVAADCLASTAGT